MLQQRGDMYRRHDRLDFQRRKHERHPTCRSQHLGEALALAGRPRDQNDAAG
jgi:hypothetical protein